MVFTMAIICTGKHLPTSSTRLIMDRSPDSPVNFPPSFELGFQVYQILVNVEGSVSDMAES